MDCPAAVEEIELFADAEDEHLLAWAFCGRDAQANDLLRWAEALAARSCRKSAGVTFFPSRRRNKEEEEDAGVDAKPLAQSGAKAIRYRTKEHEYQVSAGAFFQVNRHLIDELVAVVTGDASGETGAGPVCRSRAIFGSIGAPDSSHIECRGVTDSAWRLCAECPCERESGRRAD